MSTTNTLIQVIDAAVALDMLVARFSKDENLDQNTQRLIDLYRIRKDRDWTPEEQAEIDAMREASQQDRKDAVSDYHNV